MTDQDDLRYPTGCFRPLATNMPGVCAAHIEALRSPIDGSPVFVDALYARWVALLKSMSEEGFERGFNHPEMSRQNLAATLTLYDWHSCHHVPPTPTCASAWRGR